MCSDKLFIFVNEKVDSPNAGPYVSAILLLLFVETGPVEPISVTGFIPVITPTTEFDKPQDI